MNLEQYKSIFDEYYHPIRNFLYYKLKDIDLAEDFAQEVFIRAWSKRDTIILNTVKSYLFKIANNLVINHYKSARTRFEFELDGQDKSTTTETPDYMMEKDEFALQLNNALTNLSENQRVVFLMNRIDDLTYKEIAERLEISVKAVEKRMQGALESLRSIIKLKF